MSSSESNQSAPGSPLPRKIEEMPTRHPTTNKKKQQGSASFRRTLQHEAQGQYSSQKHSARVSKSQQLRESLITLADEKSRCLYSGRYGDAYELQSQIRRTRSVLNRTELKELNRTHKQEKQSITQAYHEEVAFFQSAWGNYFQKYEQRQKTKLKEFKLQQSSQIEFVREKLRKKCGSLRHPSRDVLDLEKQEQYFMRQGNIAELMQVRKEKQKLIRSLKEERREMINKWTQIQGNQLERFQSKRYSTLMSRLEEQRKDQEKVFLTQKKRLKQKYKNIMGQLRHEQVMTTYFITRRQTEE